jgi:hypothetical protein
MPRPELLYAQVVKTMRRRWLVEVKHRVVFGPQAAVEKVLAACGWQMNTSRTPEMAAELTDHVWTLKEVLMFRVPPWPQPLTV